MKTKHLFFSVCLIAIAFTTKAQIKVTTGGKASIGYAGTPPSNSRTHLVGNTLFAMNSSGSGAMIRGTNTGISAIKPDYTWYGDSTTGIFRPANSIIGISVAGYEKFRFNSNGANNCGQLLSSNTSYTNATTPDYSWNNDVNTGMYHPGADLLGFVTGGVERFRFNNSGQFVSTSTITTNVSTPDLSWNSDPNTGIYRPGTDILGFVANGSEKMRINNSGQILNSNSTSSVATPDFSWNSDPNTGFYRIGEDKIGFATAGTERMRIDSEKIIFNHWTDVTVDWSGPSGSACIFPETSWYLQLGKSDKFIGDAYITHELYIVAPSAYSDSRLKRNVDYELNTLDKLKLLKPAKYNFNDILFTGIQEARKNKYTSTLEYGLIAQEVMTIFPELVDQDSTTGYYSVKYTEFIPMLIDAVQKQQTQIEILQTELNTCCARRTSTNITNRTISNTTIEANSEASNWLAQNKPNPFNKETVIEYNIVQEGKGSILIFDMNGKLLKTIPVKIPGKGSVTITANDLPAGMYYYTLVVNDNEVDTKKMILTQ